jgi:hypothetical protein
MTTTEKGGYTPESSNIIDTATSIQALQQMGALVSLDRTAIKLTDTPFRAYKLNGDNPDKPFDGIGNGKDKMKYVSLKNSSNLTITYEDGTISKFYVGTTPPPKPEQNQ